MSAFIVFVFRLLALAAGLVLAAGVMAATLLGATAWLLHAAWARLTGGTPRQPSTPSLARASGGNPTCLRAA